MKNIASYPNTRLRRTRVGDAMRGLVQEHDLSAGKLIYPLFITSDQDQDVVIPSMPGIRRLRIGELPEEAADLLALGLTTVMLFPVIELGKKSTDAAEAWNGDGLVQTAIRTLKASVPQLLVIADVALDPFTSHGQDGLVDEQGYVVNDATVEALVKQAVSHAHAGADLVAPSDMMDGRVAAIRNALEKDGYHNTGILAYSVKYASAFYGPFRNAIGSSSSLGKVDKRSYQMDPANSDEALREVALDIQEGADIIMVKPGLPYLDVIQRIKQTFNVPTFAYQVSGEYTMLKTAALNGYLDERLTVLETLLAFKRAGADAVVSYYAKQVAEWLRDEPSSLYGR